MGLSKDGILAGQQTATATPVTPALSLPNTEWGLDYTPTNFSSAQVNDTQVVSEPRQGWYHYAGDIGTEVGASGLDILWKSLLGKYTFAVDTPVAGANTHTHTMATSAAEFLDMHTEGLTIEAGSGDIFLTYDTCAVSSVTLDMPAPGFMTATWSIVGREETQDTTGETHAPASVTTMIDNFMVTFSVNSVTQPLRTFNMTIDRALEGDWINTAKTIQKWRSGGDFDPITGSFEIQHAYHHNTYKRPDGNRLYPVHNNYHSTKDKDNRSISYPRR
jgi:hypothetical protein